MPPERKNVVSPILKESTRYRALIVEAAEVFEVPPERLTGVIYLHTYDRSGEENGSSSGVLYAPDDMEVIKCNGRNHTVSKIKQLLEIDLTETVYMVRYLGHNVTVQPNTFFVRRGNEIVVFDLHGEADDRYKTIFYSTTDRREREYLTQTDESGLTYWRTVIPIDENGLEFSTHEELEDVGENSRKGISPYTSFGGCLRPTRSKDAPLFVEWIKEEIVNLTPYNFS